MSDSLSFIALMLGRGLALLGLAFVIHVWLRHRSAALQNHFWRSVILALIVMPLLTLMPPLWQLPVVAPPLELAIQEFSLNGIETSPTAVIVTEKAPLEVVEEGEPGTSFAVVSALILWILGALYLLGRFGIGYVQLTRMKRRSVPLPSGSAWLGESPSPGFRILSSDHVPVPLVFGIARPCLLLPTRVLEVSAEDRQMILRHELAHVRRRDGVFQLLHCLALALHWPNPLAWLAVNRMRLSEERAVDDVVLSEGHRPIDYAELLSRFASGTFMNNHTPLHAMAQASTVRKRVSCVLNAKQDRHAPSPWFKVGLSTFLLLGLILLGSLHARATIASDETVNVDAPNAVDRVTLVMKPTGGGPVDLEKLARGKDLYTAICSACHQPNGQGTPEVFPPLAGSEWLDGDTDRLIKIMLKGLMGELEVKGTSYNSLMPPWEGALNDEQMADMLSYVQNEWGPKDTADVSVDKVKEVRAAVKDKAALYQVTEILKEHPLIEK